jgi:diguanylate cyclase (GGDEF)-like protein
MTTVENSALSGAVRQGQSDVNWSWADPAPSDTEQRTQALLELSCDWVWDMDESLRLTSVRPTGYGQTPFKDEDVIGRRLWEPEGELIRPASWAEHQATLEARRPFRDLVVRRWLPTGEAVYHLTSGDPVFDPKGRFCGYRGIGKDVTELMRMQQSAEQLASHDALTRLPNRQAFDERAQRLLSNAYADGQKCAMLYIDLDDFRHLNNGYGHRIGDEALALVAERMRSVVSEPHLLGRRGGDELVALLVNLPQPEFAQDTARRLIEAISKPARVLGMEITVTPSIGIAYFPQDGVDLDSLFNAADAAMFQAKKEGRCTYAFFTPAVQRRVNLRVRLEQRLRPTIEARDFRLNYQPVVSMADGRMIGAEALLRWKDPELGEISPGEFIPIAKESGLIIEIGDWVLREACRQIQIWRQIGVPPLPIAINVSANQLQQIGFTDRVLAVLKQFGLVSGDIEIEVTEQDVLDATDVAQDNLERLHRAGVKIALDDFGMGYSSLSHLRRLPISRLKIDRSFTLECARDANALTIVKAVIEMAHDLQPRLSVTAEGIETLVHQKWMQHLGCDSAQGFLLARPLSAEDFVSKFAGASEIGREKSLMR